MTAPRKSAATGGRRKRPAAKKKTSPVIQCEPCMEIAQAEALLAQVRELLEQPEPVTVSASGVETITTPCVQVFCVLARALAGRDQSIVWEKPSARLVEIADVLGVRDELALPAA